MASPTTALSDSASPHGLKTTNSPLLVCTAFVNGAGRALSPEYTSMDEDARGNVLTPGGRRSILSVQNSSSRLRSTSESYSVTKDLKDRNACKINASFSNPSLLQAPTNINLKIRHAGLRYGRSVSMVIDSPSSESATSKSPTSIHSDGSWGDRSESATGDKKEGLQGLALSNSRESAMSQSQPVLSPIQIGPIARKNFREHTTVEEEATMYTSQLLTVPGKERVSTIQGNSSEAPLLVLNPFSPYSPGFMGVGLGTVIVLRSAHNEPIDLNEYCQMVNVRPKDDEDYDSDEEEEEVVEEMHGEEEEEEEEEVHIAVAHDEKNNVVQECVLTEPATPELEPENTVHVDAGILTITITEVETSMCTPAAFVSDASESASHDGTPSTSTSEENRITESESELESKSETIAKQWRRDHSTSLIIQRPDGSTVEHIVHNETFSESQFLEKRKQRQGSQGRLSSSGSLRLATRRTPGSVGPSSPLVYSSFERLGSPSAVTSAAFDALTSVSEHDASIPSPSISVNRSMTQPTTTHQGRLVSPSSSTEFSQSDGIKSKKPAKINTNLPRSGIQDVSKPISKPTDRSSFLMKYGKNKSTLFKSNGEEEQVISSKVSRSGKLFATKIKTIAVFEYNTSKKLGKGNFGIVYQGKRISEELEVAIKKITRKLPGEIEKLGLVQREMRVCRLFNNRTGIVSLLDIITTNKHHYLVFEKAEGDLAEMLKVRSRDSLSGRDLNQQPQSPSSSLGTIFSIQEIRSIMRTVVLGAQALHKEGYSHKDIKPANILFREGRGLLCDFGLCSKADELPQNQFFGTQDYASPEARRVGGHRICDYIQGDVYSLGAVLYELATGSVLSKVIGQGLNWQKIAFFGGWSFSELLQGMVNDIEKRWDIDQVVASRFWNESPAAAPSPCPTSALGAETGPRQVNPAEIGLPITPTTPTTPTEGGTCPK